MGECRRASRGDLAQSRGLTAAGLFLGFRTIESCTLEGSLSSICESPLPGDLASAGTVCLAVRSLFEAKRCIFQSVHPDPEGGEPEGQERSLKIFWFSASFRLWPRAFISELKTLI